MMSSRDWSRVAPKTVSDRSALLYKCGRKCFLGPGKTFLRWITSAKKYKKESGCCVMSFCVVECE